MTRMEVWKFKRALYDSFKLISNKTDILIAATEILPMIIENEEDLEFTTEQLKDVGSISASFLRGIGDKLEFSSKKWRTIDYNKMLTSLVNSQKVVIDFLESYNKYLMSVNLKGGKSLKILTK